MPRPLRSALSCGVLAALAALLLALPARAQGDAVYWRDTFAVPGTHYEPLDTPNHGTYTMARQGSTVYVGGLFDHVDDVPVLNIAQWDGAQWRPLGGGLDGIVEDLLVTADGSLYATGWFTRAYQTDGTALTVNRIARWDGTAWHALATGLPPEADHGTALAPRPGGGIYVGTYGLWRGVVGWTGTGWANMGTVYGMVYDLALSPSGDLYVGGSLTGVISPGGATINQRGVYRWNGTAWSLAGGGGPTNEVRTLAFDGATLYAGGHIISLRQPDGTLTPAAHVARWDGTAWSGVGGGVIINSIDRYVLDLLPDGAGGLWVAGELEGGRSTDGSPDVASRRLVHWSGTGWSGEADLPLALNLDDAIPRALLADGAGGLLLAGYFGAVRAGDAVLPARGLARWDGAAWTQVTAHPNDHGLGNAYAVRALQPSACGRILAGGWFASAGRTGSAGVAAWGEGGWTGFGGGLRQSFGRPADVVALAPAGCVGGAERFYVSGGFTAAVNGDGSTTAAAGTAYWNGAAWETLAGGALGVVNAFLSDGTGVYVGGDFSGVRDASGATLPYVDLAYWSPGTGWAPAGAFPAEDSNFPGVLALARAADGALYAGGAFEAVEQPGGASLAVEHLARWTGTTWERIGGPVASFSFNGTVNALAFGPDGRLYVGGEFESVRRSDGTTLPARHVAVWDGQAWSALGAGPNAPDGVSALAFDAAGRLHVNGIAGAAAAVWNGQTWVSRGAGLEGNSVKALLFGADGLLYVGAAHPHVGAQGSPGLGVWDAPTATPAEPGAPAPPTALTLAVAPNPAHGRASFHFTLPTASPMRLAVYDALGREVAVVTDRALPAGAHEAALDAAALAPGVYVARLTAGAETAVRRLTVVR